MYAAEGDCAVGKLASGNVLRAPARMRMRIYFIDEARARGLESGSSDVGESLDSPTRRSSHRRRCRAADAAPTARQRRGGGAATALCS